MRVKTCLELSVLPGPSICERGPTKICQTPKFSTGGIEGPKQIPNGLQTLWESASQTEPKSCEVVVGQHLLRPYFTFQAEREGLGSGVKIASSPVTAPCKRRQRAVGEAESAGDPFLRCADLILPWLTPQELAAVSLASADLRRASLSVSRRRSSDATRGLEPLPVPFLNAVDSRPYAYFLYTPSSRVLSPPNDALLLRQSWGSSRTLARPTAFPSRGAADVVVGGVVLGCGCERCEGRDCACWSGDGGGEGLVVVSECGPGCGCGSECGNRASQRGVDVRLKIVRDKMKGWCLFADQAIEKGRFVCEYAGELLTTKEARARQKEYDELASSGGFSSALLVVREHLPSGKACLRINIDATKVGNVGRFINHSCDGGNLSTVLVRSTGALLPRLCFFASNDIREGEELSFSYGEIRLRSNGLQCYCGASNCFGILPSEHT